MNNNYKEELSLHVEKIFKQYSNPGLYICDIATGGGKSYTIGKLTCEYYLKHFDRVIILCVQKKLIDGMNREVNKFINSPESLIKPEEKLVIENNQDVIKKAINEGYFNKLIEEIDYQIGEQRRHNYKVNSLQYSLSTIKKIYKAIENLNSLSGNNTNDYLNAQFTDTEQSLRGAVRYFFDSFKKHLEHTGQVKRVTYENIVRRFPSLIDVYPQVGYKNKKVLIMTVHKAIYGIDPILTEKIQLNDFAGRSGKSLILFDESDQAAVTIRNAIIDQSIDQSEGYRRFANGYNGFLQYKDLLDNPELMSDAYYGTEQEKCLKRAKKILSSDWKKVFGDTNVFKSIFLGDDEDLEKFRRGVFFSGPVLKVNVSQKGDKTDSYICYKNGDRQFTLMHSKDMEALKKQFQIVVPMKQFLTLMTSCTSAVKAQFSKVIRDMLKANRERFIQQDRNPDVADKNTYLGLPTLEREIHTFFSRFETNAERQFETQIKNFITNRKNIIFKQGDETIKLPDTTVYSQGVQLFQEEIDERDNQHRVRLSCREISTTPEKMIVDLVNTERTTVVLCSATASSRSVVSNCDIAYLKQVLGNKVQVLSKEDRERFDDLMAKTYPEGHHIEIVPLGHYEFTDARPNHLQLPEKYRALFSKEAQEEGLCDAWFRETCRELDKKCSNPGDKFFQLYRLLQFIEAYHWFITHDDIHSMIFFQNRTGDKDQKQFNALSRLIDGSFPKGVSFDGEIPTDWSLNEHLRISKDWDEVENNILSELGTNKDTKLMLVTAYGSFKAGTNMQYDIPDGLDYIAGDSWEGDGKRKKDWDAVYLQSPAGYLMINDDGTEMTYEKSLYNAMLVLMMLFERGCLSKGDVATWLNHALSDKFYFGPKNNPGITKDKAAWAQTVVEQAVGRLCRTRNKPHTTYILLDEDIKPFIKKTNLEKSLTKEFKALAQYILGHPAFSDTTDDPDEIIRCNNARYSQDQLARILKNALRYTPHPTEYQEELEEDIEEGNDEIPHFVEVSQTMNQMFKQIIIRKPVITSLDDLTDDERKLTFLDKCYSDWPRDDKGGITYFYDEWKHACPANKGKRFPYPVSPAYVRLDILMKNPIIKSYFEDKGYATDWRQDGLILHPQILATFYAGEIGEEAFKALILHYTHCTEDRIKHLTGKEYELADFVVCNDDGSHRVAFDIKNMNPNIDHNDMFRDMSTTDKRVEKKRRLGCRYITVNMLELAHPSMDNDEISGVIDNDGQILPEAISRLKRLVGDES